MPKTPAPATSETNAASQTPRDAVHDSAQQIWQAGLGAFTRAQAEGSKAFEALVQEGVNLQRKTQAAAEQRLAEATSRMNSMATQLSGKAGGSWDKLEGLFEDRVARALNKLGMPSAKDVQALAERIDALSQAVEKLSAQHQAASQVAAPAAVRATAPRKAAPRKASAAKASASKAATPARRKAAARSKG